MLPTSWAALVCRAFLSRWWMVHPVFLSARAGQLPRASVDEVPMVVVHDLESGKFMSWPSEWVYAHRTGE